jgi:hypothetical protein
MISEELIKFAFLKRTLGRQNEWQWNHLEYYRKKAREKWRKNREECNKKNVRRRERLADTYVRDLLSQRFKTKYRQWPEDIIDAYRRIVAIKRKIRKLREVLNER